MGGDVAIPSVAVELCTVLKNGDVVTLLSTTTGPDGKFDFQCMPPGEYTLVELNPPGFLDVKDSDGANPNEISVKNVTTADSPVNNQFVDEHPATLAPTPTSMNPAAPSVVGTSSPAAAANPTNAPVVGDPTPGTTTATLTTPSSIGTSSPTRSILGSISGNVSEDNNNDDSGDVDLAGVPIILKDQSGTVVATTTTDSMGNYPRCHEDGCDSFL